MPESNAEIAERKELSGASADASNSEILDSSDSISDPGPEARPCSDADSNSEKSPSVHMTEEDAEQ